MPMYMKYQYFYKEVYVGENGVKPPAEQLREWRKAHEDRYARAILSDPPKSSISETVPYPGLVVILGDVGSGKSGLAHEIAWNFYKKRKIQATIHLPRSNPKLKTKAKKILPSWFTIADDVSKWPHNNIVIADEASQLAHARRSSSKDNLAVDDLLGICRQRSQTILFIVHHTKKLDLEILRAAHTILYKRPTYSHGFFERDEYTDIVWKALDFFNSIESPTMKLRTTMAVETGDKFRITQFTNKLPNWWSGELSIIFKDGGRKL